jgi:hypothetical protein
MDKVLGEEMKPERLEMRDKELGIRASELKLERLGRRDAEKGNGEES